MSGLSRPCAGTCPSGAMQVFVPSPLRWFQWHPAELRSAPQSALTGPSRSAAAARLPVPWPEGHAPIGPHPAGFRSGSFHCDGRFYVRNSLVTSGLRPCRAKTLAPAIRAGTLPALVLGFPCACCAEYPCDTSAAEYTGILGLNLAQCRYRLGPGACRAKIQTRVGGRQRGAPRLPI